MGGLIPANTNLADGFWGKLAKVAAQAIDSAGPDRSNLSMPPPMEAFQPGGSHYLGLDYGTFIFDKSGEWNDFIIGGFKHPEFLRFKPRDDVMNPIISFEGQPYLMRRGAGVGYKGADDVMLLDKGAAEDINPLLKARFMELTEPPEMWGAKKPYQGWNMWPKAETSRLTGRGRW